MCVKMLLWKFCFRFQNSIKIPDLLWRFPFKDDGPRDFETSISMALNKKYLLLVEDSAYGFKLGLLWKWNLVYFVSYKMRFDLFRGGSRAAAACKMECFAIIVNDFQSLTIIKKLSILDIAAALDPPLMLLQNTTAFLSQNGYFITKCDKTYITKCVTLFLLKNVADLFKNVTIVTKCFGFITKCESYYKMRRLIQ